MGLVPRTATGHAGHFCGRVQHRLPGSGTANGERKDLLRGLPVHRHGHWFIASPILSGTALFAQGIGLILSIMNARFGDVMYIVGVVLGALYFLTPVLYPMSLVETHSSALAWVVKLNPMSWYVEAMHDAMYTLTTVSVLEVLALLVGGFLVFWAGFSIFNRFSEDIGEML